MSAILSLLKPIGIKEIASTGIIALSRDIKNQ
jgi:acetolactate synthase small subunit